MPRRFDEGHPACRLGLVEVRLIAQAPWPMQWLMTVWWSKAEVFSMHHVQ